MVDKTYPSYLQKEFKWTHFVRRKVVYKRQVVLRQERVSISEKQQSKYVSYTHLILLLFCDLVSTSWNVLRSFFVFFFQKYYSVHSSLLVFSNNIIWNTSAEMASSLSTVPIKKWMVLFTLHQLMYIMMLKLIQWFHHFYSDFPNSSAKISVNDRDNPG